MHELHRAFVQYIPVQHMPTLHTLKKKIHIDFEERFWYKAFSLIKEQCYHSMNSEEKIQYSCRCIKIPADDKKCVEVMITDKLVIPEIL